MSNKYDYRKLRGRIVEKLETQKKFEELMELSGTTITEKLNSRIDFKQSEIIKACSILDIPPEEIKDYFFSIQS